MAVILWVSYGYPMGILWDDPNFCPIKGERRKRKKSGGGVRMERKESGGGLGMERKKRDFL